MAYARSAAFKSLQRRLRELHSVVAHAWRLKKGGKRLPIYKEALLSSSVLLSFAHFESYVGDVTNDVCKAFCSAALSSAQFPAALRAHVAVGSKLKGWGEIQDPTKQRAQILAHKANGGFEILNDLTVPLKIDVDSILVDVSYPKLKNVKKLLNRLGVDDPIASLIKSGGHSISQKLISIHDARAELAHTGQAPNWTKTDYQHRLQELLQFAAAMDRVLFTLVASTVKSTNWIR